MKKIFRKLILILLLAFAIMNVVAYIHAYRFTHFSNSKIARTKDPKSLSIVDKVTVLFSGIDNPRPRLKATPELPFETYHVASTVQLECWRIQSPNARGTVIMFHGYAGEKSSLLERGALFRAMGLNTVLVDFMGSGGSEGMSTTVGFEEARQVKDCFNDLIGRGEKNIFLFGTSMGAAAILKSVYDYQIKPNAIVLECPFGSLSETVAARFKMMNVPTFPMAPLLTFWGGLQNGYWAFSHNPSTYAKSVDTPTLILYGEQDERVTLAESREIAANLHGPKELITYHDAGHNVFVLGKEERWAADVQSFIALY
jgi:alpha-beta hydrolase superfamily lysophospholipase